jgi:archaellum biogenesis ATPase FlaH
MDKIAEQIVSIRSAVGGSFVKPDPSQVEEMEKLLWKTEHALDYLRNTRALSDETIKHFRLGYHKGYNAISIPITKNGEVVNVKYRYLEPENHNSRYTSTRGCELWLYNEHGLSYAKKAGRLLIVEGEFDCMSAWQRGIKNVVSPASGKDSYSTWIELVDAIPEVYIAYDNDKAGKTAGYKLAERIGIDKCKEISYPDDVKDANDFFKKYTSDDFKKLALNAKPYYKYEFSDLSSIFDMMSTEQDETIRIKQIPMVRFGKDWLVMLSGDTNVGKTSFALNIADELARNKYPVLVLPFERGIESVGKRYLQVRYNMAEEDFRTIPQSELEELREDCSEAPVFFSKPSKENMIATIRRAKRLFGIRAVIIDHLNYFVRRSQNVNTEIDNALQDMKDAAMELGIIFFVIHHIRKMPSQKDDVFAAGKKRKPHYEDLKGASSTYQDPECVIMLYSENDNELTVDVQKNKGQMGKIVHTFNPNTGKILEHKTEIGFKTDTSSLQYKERVKIAEQVFFNE